MNSCGFGCDASLGAQLGATFGNIGTSILGAYLSGAFKSESSTTPAVTGEVRVSNANETINELQQQKANLEKDLGVQQAIAKNPAEGVDKTGIQDTNSELCQKVNDLNKKAGDYSKAQEETKTAKETYEALQQEYDAAPKEKKTELQAKLSQAKSNYEQKVNDEKTAKTALENANKEVENAKKKATDAEKTYAEKVQKRLETATKNVATLNEKIEKINEKIEKATKELGKGLKQEGKESPNLVMSQNDFNNLFTQSGELAFGTNDGVDFKKAAKAAATNFISNQTLPNAKKLMQVVNEIGGKDQCDSSIKTVIEKAEKMVEDDKQRKAQANQ